MTVEKDLHEELSSAMNEEVKETPQEEVTETADEYLNPPSSWSAGAKANWKSYDKALRAEVLKRETDFHKGLEQYKKSHESWNEVEKIFSPYQATLQSLNLSPTNAVRELLKNDHILRNGSPAQKAEATRLLFQAYGLNPQEIFQAQQQAQTIDPRLQTLQEELHQIKTGLSQSHYQAEQAQIAEAKKMIDAFSADAKNTFLPDVKELMAALLESGQAKDLQDAYDKACYAHPEVRTALLKQQQQEADKQRIEDAKRKAADAKRAGFDVSGEGAAKGGSRELSLRDELAQHFQTH